MGVILRQTPSAPIQRPAYFVQAAAKCAEGTKLYPDSKSFADILLPKPHDTIAYKLCTHSVLLPYTHIIRVTKSGSSLIYPRVEPVVFFALRQIKEKNQ